ncbi:uncharacterized protein LOC5519083 [Nematostella vectensis]|uniref:uncharacterized protein LOC5519083 n=1 Tax=Nematostella vectensis TaxID=45351 RepID=UPI0020778F93|nr:uncharacterized protein LOC5519083 [Nematostella vectensis]XP_048583000.1 uncharacterized protein LOC5519083 [Nematostella vectensis]
MYETKKNGTIDGQFVAPSANPLVGGMPWWMSPVAVLCLIGLSFAVGFILFIKVKLAGMKTVKQEKKTSKKEDKNSIEVIAVKVPDKHGPQSPTRENVRRRSSISPSHDLGNTPSMGSYGLVQAQQVRTPPKLTEGETEPGHPPESAERKKRRGPTAPQPGARTHRVSPETRQYRSRPPKGQKDRIPGQALRKVKSDPYHLREPLYMGPIELKKTRAAKTQQGQPLTKVSSDSALGSNAYPIPVSRSPRELPPLTSSRKLPSIADDGGDYDEVAVTAKKASKASCVSDDPLQTGFKSRWSRKSDITSASQSKSFANPFYDTLEVCDPYLHRASKGEEHSTEYGVAQVLEERPVHFEMIDSVYENIEQESVFQDKRADSSTPDVKRTKRRSSCAAQHRPRGSDRGEAPGVEYAKVQKGGKKGGKNGTKAPEEAIYDDVAISPINHTETKDEILHQNVDEWMTAEGESRKQRSKVKKSRSSQSFLTERIPGDTYMEVNELAQ